MKNLHTIQHDMNMFHGLLDFESSPPQRRGSTTKPRDHDDLNFTILVLLLLIVQEDPHDQDGHESLVTYIFPLEGPSSHVIQFQFSKYGVQMSFKGLIISWSWLLAIEDSGPKYNNKHSPHTNVRINSHRCLGTFGSKELGRLLEDDDISQTHLHEFEDSHHKNQFSCETGNSLATLKHTKGTSWGNPYPYSPIYTSGSYCSARTWHPTIYNA